MLQKKSRRLPVFSSGALAIFGCRVAAICGGCWWLSMPIMAAETLELETVEVVAPRFWQERLDKVPGAIAVIDAQDITAGDTKDQSMLAKSGGNIHFQQTNSSTRLTIRGISAYPNALLDPVGVAVNDVYLPMGNIQLPQLFDIDRITLLKGAQGAHFGRNSEAGVLQVETANGLAQEQLWADFQVSQTRTNGNTNPIATGIAGFSKQLNAKVNLNSALQVTQTDGYMLDIGDNFAKGGKQHLTSWHGGIVWDLDDSTTLRFNSVVEDKDLGKEFFRYATGNFATPAYSNNYNHRSNEARKTAVHSLRVVHDFDQMAFTSITGMTRFSREFALDFDASPVALGVTTSELTDRSYSQEFRLNSSNTGDNRLNWSLGTYFAQQTTDADLNFGAFTTRRKTKIKQKNAALFGFAEYAVTNRVRLGAGVRLDTLSAEGQQDFINPMGRNAYAVAQDETTWLPKITAAVDITDDAMLYASAARGYLAGGYNHNMANSADNFTFDPEYTWTYEIGSKNSLNATTNLDLIAFYADIRDKQISEVEPGGVARISNAAKVKSYGVEAAVKTDLSQHWQLSAALGWQNTAAVAFKTTRRVGMNVVAVDYSGNDLTLAPDRTYSIRLDYQNPAGWFGNLRLHGTSSVYFDAANTLQQPAYRTLDAELGYQTKHYKLTLYGSNLLDEHYLVQAVNTLRGTLVEDGKPREVGLQLSVKW